MAFSFIGLGNVACAEGDYRRAEEMYEESLALSWELRDERWASQSLEGLAWVSCDQGQAKRAARLFGAAEALREAIGTPLLPSERAGHERHVATVRARLGEEALEQAWSQGRAMSLEQAVEYTLGEDNVL